MDILILSAKYRLLEPDTPIEDYDLLMTPAIAKLLKPIVVPAIAEHIKVKKYAEVFFNLGKVYRSALDGFEVQLGQHIQIVWAEGGIGQKASAMLSWLKEKAEVRS